MSQQKRPPIPDPMKREIRQRCGFGCVLCGLPLYHYDHMEDYVVVKNHDPANITLLCDQHHAEKTKELLPLAQVQEANANPHNLRTGISKPYAFHYSGSDCEIVLGDNSCQMTGLQQDFVLIALMIDGVPLFGFVRYGAHLFLRLAMCGRFNEPILKIWENELVYTPTPWDISLVGHNLIIRQAARNIFVDILFEPPSRIVIQRGRFLFNGIEAVMTDSGLLINGEKELGRNRAFNQPVFLSLGVGPPLPGICMSLDRIDRYRALGEIGPGDWPS